MKRTILAGLFFLFLVFFSGSILEIQAETCPEFSHSVQPIVVSQPALTWLPPLGWYPSSFSSVELP